MATIPGSWNWGAGSSTEVESATEDPSPYVLGYIDLPALPKPEPAKSHEEELDKDNTDELLTEAMSKLNLAAEATKRREAASADTGDLEWVRAGGSLRDSEGRFDHERTKRIRAKVDELRAIDRAWELWDAYEERWRRLQAGRGDLGASALGVSMSGTFMDSELGLEDIPWPTEENTANWINLDRARQEEESNMPAFRLRPASKQVVLSASTSNKPLPLPAPGQPPVSVSHSSSIPLDPAAEKAQQMKRPMQVLLERSQLVNLSAEKINPFLLSPITTERSSPDPSSSSTPTSDRDHPDSTDRKPSSVNKRIRREMLRWHPDKFDISVLPRVREADRERVSDGVGIVWRWLSEKAPRGRRTTRGALQM